MARPTTIRPTGLPTPTLEPAQHKEMLRTVKEVLEVAQRQRGDPLKSFVRLEELVELGLADSNGNLMTSTSIGGSESSDAAMLAFFQGE